MNHRERKGSRPNHYHHKHYMLLLHKIQSINIIEIPMVLPMIYQGSPRSKLPNVSLPCLKPLRSILLRVLFVKLPRNFTRLDNAQITHGIFQSQIIHGKITQWKFSLGKITQGKIIQGKIIQYGITKCGITMGKITRLNNWNGNTLVKCV